MSRSEQPSGGVAGPASWVIGIVVAFCAVMLLKWLALVALAVLAVVGFVRWARGGRVRSAASVDDRAPERRSEVPTRAGRRSSPADDCTWCGLLGGHRDDGGRVVRPRHAHRP